MPDQARGDLRAQWQDEPRYFHEALTFHVHLVHGVVPTAAELDEALGPPVVVAESPAAIPLVDYTEHVDERASPWFQRALRVGGGIVFVDVDPDRVDRETGAVEPPIALYAFTPALVRLQEILEPRLRHAAQWIFVLDVLVLFLCLLVFVRCALVPGVWRWVWPIVPLLAAGIWLSARGTRGYLALRDLHLAHFEVTLGLFAVAVVLLLRSFARQLSRPPPGRG